MPDRIYVTYSPTTAPGSYHAAIHYERTDAGGKVIQHSVVEAKPEKLDRLRTLDKAIGVVEEVSREDNGPSRFGNIQAAVRGTGPEDQPPYPYEDIAEGDDLSPNFARMQLFAHGVNRAGFAYRGDHQNSNSFASAALRAGGLPPATAVAHDPAGPVGELLDFFTPGLNEPLRAPIGQSADDAPVNVARDAGGDGNSTSSLLSLRDLNQLVPPPQPGGMSDIMSNNPVRYLGRRVVGPAQATVFDAGAPALQFAPSNGPPLGVASGQPMPKFPVPPPIWGRPKDSGASDEDDWFTRLLKAPR